MVRIVGWMLFGCGVVVGCAAGRIGEPRWTAYCCEGGTVQEPEGCQRAAGLCGHAAALAMECRDHDGCTTGAIDCYCCRQAGQTRCTAVLRSSRTAHRGPPEPEPEAEDPPLPPLLRPSQGTVFSPF